MKATKLIGLCLTLCSVSVFAQTNTYYLTSYAALKNAVSDGKIIRIVAIGNKCQAPYPSTINISPHLFTIATAPGVDSVSATDSLSTDADPSSKGNLATEMTHYTFLPQNGTSGSFNCQNPQGCMLIDQSAYSMTGSKLTNYPEAHCDIGTAVMLISN